MSEHEPHEVNLRTRGITIGPFSSHRTREVKRRPEWFWPMVIVLAFVVTFPVAALMIVLAFAITFALAWSASRLVERRRRKRVPAEF